MKTPRKYRPSTLLPLVNAYPSDDETSSKVRLSFYILRTYLGEQWVQSNIVDSLRAFSFMRELHGTSDNLGFQETTALLADIIYDLQDAAGFNKWAERLKHKDLESAFCEAFSAKLFQMFGHKIKFSQRKGIKGEDYDFDSEFGGIEFAVEVKSRLESTRKYPRFKTIYNTLEEARKSLRRGSPEIVVLFLPSRWIEFSLFRHTLDTALSKLWRNSSRVEYVVIVWFQFLGVNAGPRGHMMKYHFFKNCRTSEKKPFMRPYHELAPRGDFNFWADLKKYRKALGRTEAPGDESIRPDASREAAAAHSSSAKET